MADTTAVQLGCASCSKIEFPEGEPLQRCAGCQKIHYCSKDCQKANWSEHKNTCKAARVNQKSTSSNNASTNGPSSSSPKVTIEAMMAITTKAWLNNLPEQQVYEYLIDSYRMRIEDDVDTRTVYGGADPRPDFRRYLRKAEAKPGILPSWWTEEKRKACVAKGCKKDQ